MGEENPGTKRIKRSREKHHEKKARVKEEDEKQIQEEGSDDDDEDDGDINSFLREMVDAKSRPKSKPKAQKPPGEKKKPKRPPLPPRKRMKPGVIINTAENKYQILSLLGAGGFGDVYKVRQLDSKLKEDVFALKTETTGPSGKALNRLKIEMTIFEEYSNLPEKERQHFCRMVDKGRTKQFKFIIMELIGTSLDNLQRKNPEKCFSLSTSLQLAIQTVKAIADFHNLGWLHRDIKPQNFATGIKTRARIVYLLDFGIARRFMDKKTKAIRVPREKVKFIGTVRFASRSCHLSREQGRKDDLESWIFMVIEFTKHAALPWSRITDRQIVCNFKEKLFAGTYTDHIEKLPTEIHRIMGYINELKYESAPDYEYIERLLQKAAQRRKIDLNERFDWERKQDRSDMLSQRSLSARNARSEFPEYKTRPRELTSEKSVSVRSGRSAITMKKTKTTAERKKPINEGKAEVRKTQIELKTQLNDVLIKSSF